MYLFNNTFLIDRNEYAWWAQWMKETYIAQIEDTCKAENLQAEVRIFKVSNENAGPDELTFSCQWLCETISALGIIEKLNRNLASQLIALKDDKCLSFATLMQEVKL